MGTTLCFPPKSSKEIKTCSTHLLPAVNTPAVNILEYIEKIQQLEEYKKLDPKTTQDIQNLYDAAAKDWKKFNSDAYYMVKEMKG